MEPEINVNKEEKCNVPDNSVNAAMLISSFATFVKELEVETKSLRDARTLHQALNNIENNSMQEHINDIESMLTRLEESNSYFEEALNKEASFLIKSKAIMKRAEQQKVIIDKLEESIIKKKIDNFENEIRIPEDEFEQVSKITRSRLTCQIVNDCYRFLVNYILEKSKILRYPRNKLPRSAEQSYQKYLELKHPDHQNRMFVTESELRNTIIFQNGDSSGKSVLQTLRALQRIKLVRSTNENTYFLVHEPTSC